MNKVQMAAPIGRFQRYPTESSKKVLYSLYAVLLVTIGFLIVLVNFQVIDKPVAVDCRKG